MNKINGKEENKILSIFCVDSVFITEACRSWKLYKVIYSDPPWRYKFSRSKKRTIENNYPTMALEEICALQIPAEKNAVLYLWTTVPILEQAFEVMRAWGFKYKTNAVWDKKIKGMGYWFRGQHEHLLVGVKGKFSPPKDSKRIGSVYQEQRLRKHSKKPDFIRNKIHEWFPEFSKLEMFAREKTENWDVFGNEVESDVDLNVNL